MQYKLKERGGNDENIKKNNFYSSINFDEYSTTKSYLKYQQLID